MDAFPLFARLHGLPCLVVGGGDVALRKVRALRRAGAIVTVNAPALGTELAGLVAAGDVRHVAGTFEPGLVEAALLVIAATDDRTVNHAVAAAAATARRLCNVVDDGDASSFIVPSVIDRSPLVIAVGSNGAAPMLARLVRQQIDTWLPARIGALARWIARWRPRVSGAVSGHDARVRLWQDVIDGAEADQVLAGRDAAADALMARRLAGVPGAAAAGEAWLVGAGPGDPELITRRGAALLARADAVLYDALVPPAILDLARRDAEFVCVGKRAGAASWRQEDINRELVLRVRRGQRVCRLKGGDPFVFGRGGEELEALAAAGLGYQVVPGVTAATGCAAYAGIPLTHRDLADGVSIVTGHRADARPEPNWAALAASGQTLVIYMGARRLEALCATLVEHGRPAGTPAAVIEQGTTDAQRVIGATLADLPARARAAGLGTPALVIVGEVAALAGTLGWFAPAALPGERAALQ